MTFPEGFEVAIHRSITQPIMVAGLPRKLGLLLWTVAAAFVLGLHQMWVFPIACALHCGLAAAAKRDPHFFEIFLRALHARQRLQP